MVFLPIVSFLWVPVCGCVYAGCQELGGETAVLLLPAGNSLVTCNSLTNQTIYKPAERKKRSPQPCSLPLFLYCQRSGLVSGISSEKFWLSNTETVSTLLAQPKTFHTKAMISNSNFCYNENSPAVTNPVYHYNYYSMNHITSARKKWKQFRIEMWRSQTTQIFWTALWNEW